MRKQIYTFPYAAPIDLRLYAEGRNALYYSSGVHTIYDGHVRMPKEGQVQGQEVLATGTAKIRLCGHIMAKLFDQASASAGQCATVELRHRSSVDILGGFVAAQDHARVDGKQSHILVVSGSPTIIARACIVVIYPGATPVLDIDTHTTVFRCPGAEESTPRAFAVAEAGAAV